MEALPATPTRVCKDPVAVLIVETDFLVRWRAADFLRERGYTVIEATDALDAIGLFASGIRVDLAFSDVRLTDELNQIGLTEWFEKHHPGVPLLLTSNDRAELAKVAVSGTRRFIAKPYELIELHSHIESMLNRS